MTVLAVLSLSLILAGLVVCVLASAAGDTEDLGRVIPGWMRRGR